MSIIIFTYTCMWHIVGSAAMYATMCYYGTLEEYAERGITQAWFSIFMTSSCLNNVGLSLLNDSCMAITDRTGTLLIMGWAIVLGARQRLRGSRTEPRVQQAAVLGAGYAATVSRAAKPTAAVFFLD